MKFRFRGATDATYKLHSKETPTETIGRLLEHVVAEMQGFCDGYHTAERLLEELMTDDDANDAHSHAADNYLCAAIAHLVCAILHFNACPLTRITLHTVPAYVVPGEPCYTHVHEGVVRLYVFPGAVRRFVRNTAIANADVIMADAHDTTSVSESAMIAKAVAHDVQLKTSSLTRCGYRIIALADHTATHLLEDLAGSTDWLTHTTFGRKNGQTLHTLYEVDLIDVRGASRSLDTLYRRAVDPFSAAATASFLPAIEIPWSVNDAYSGNAAALTAPPLHLQICGKDV